MARRSAPARTPRSTATLDRDRILASAIALADGDGIEAVSMRRLGQELGVDPMSIYHHVRDKEALLDGVADAVVRDIAPAPRVGDWRAQLRATIMAARATMLRHPWMPAVLKGSQAPGPATLAHLDVVLGILRSGGFSLDQTHHALHVLGSRVLGFSQDLFDDAGAASRDPDAAALMVRQLSLAYPHLGELAAAASHGGALGGCDDDVEFAFGLDLILDGLDRVRDGGTGR